jgi:hypothetical protein
MRKNSPLSNMAKFGDAYTPRLKKIPSVTRAMKKTLVINDNDYE